MILELMKTRTFLESITTPLEPIFFKIQITTLVRNNFCLSFCIFYRNILHLSLILDKIQKYKKGKIRTTRTITDSPNLVNDYLSSDRSSSIFFASERRKPFATVIWPPLVSIMMSAKNRPTFSDTLPMPAR